MANLWRPASTLRARAQPLPARPKLFFGFAFGVSGIAAAALGTWADHTSLQHVFAMCAYLPLLGILAALLPRLETHRL